MFRSKSKSTIATRAVRAVGLYNPVFYLLSLFYWPGKEIEIRRTRKKITKAKMNTCSIQS